MAAPFVWTAARIYDLDRFQAGSSVSFTPEETLDALDQEYDGVFRGLTVPLLIPQLRASATGANRLAAYIAQAQADPTNQTDNAIRMSVFKLAAAMSPADELVKNVATTMRDGNLVGSTLKDVPLKELVRLYEQHGNGAGQSSTQPPPADVAQAPAMDDDQLMARAPAAEARAPAMDDDQPMAPAPAAEARAPAMDDDQPMAPAPAAEARAPAMDDDQPMAPAPAAEARAPAMDDDQPMPPAPAAVAPVVAMDEDRPSKTAPDADVAPSQAPPKPKAPSKRKAVAKPAAASPAKAQGAAGDATYPMDKKTRTATELICSTNAQLDAIVKELQAKEAAKAALENELLDLKRRCGDTVKTCTQQVESLKLGITAAAHSVDSTLSVVDQCRAQMSALQQRVSQSIGSVWSGGAHADVLQSTASILAGCSIDEPADVWPLVVLAIKARCEGKALAWDERGLQEYILSTEYRATPAAKILPGDT